MVIIKDILASLKMASNPLNTAIRQLITTNKPIIKYGVLSKYLVVKKDIIVLITIQSIAK